MTQIEEIVRQALGQVLRRPAPDIDIACDLHDDYGMSSLDLIMMMTSVCKQAGIALTDFDENDLAGLKRAQDLVKLLEAKLASREATP